MPKLAHALASALALVSVARAGDVVVTVTGTVFSVNPGPSGGPFAGVAPQDPVTLRVEVFVPGVVVVPNQYVNYAVDGARSSLTIGAASAALGAATLSIQDAFPVADGIRMPTAPIAGGGTLAFEAGDSTGALFSSVDITQNLGTWPASVFASYSFFYFLPGGFIDLQPTQVSISLPSLGASFCSPAVPNSTGAPGRISAQGSTSVSANDVMLLASSLPTNAFGYFLASRTLGTTPLPTPPFGVVCLGGAIGRFSQQVQSSGASGSFSLVIDLAAVPQPAGPVAVVAGETWHFQAWHRDALGGAPTSNLTDGVSVSFN